MNFFWANRWFFESNSLDSWAINWCCSYLKKSRAIRSWSLFCKEQQEWFAHSHSFVKSVERNSQGEERISHICSLILAILSERAIERIPNPGSRGGGGWRRMNLLSSSPSSTLLTLPLKMTSLGGDWVLVEVVAGEGWVYEEPHSNPHQLFSLSL